MQYGEIYVGGRWVPADGGGTFEVCSPSTRERVGRAAAGGPAEARRAIDAAADAFPAWAATPARDRGLFLLKIRDLMLERLEPLARTITLEQGKPLKEARAEIAYAAEFVTWSAEEGKRVAGETIPASTPNKRHLVLKQPIGVVGAITPWNFPSAMITRKVAPALAAGCTVVVKPAEQTPLSAIELFRLFHEAGLPAGVANLVTGEPAPIGREFLENPRVRKITFTGSTEVGKILMRGAADQVKKISLELGGCAPFIVFEDADLDKAADGLVITKFRNAGQTCICANRAFVHEKVYDAFQERLVGRVRTLKVGDGLAEGTTIGPLIDRAAFDKVSEHVGDAVRQGARVLCGGRGTPESGQGRGYFYEPTVLGESTPAMKVVSEETFGPVAPLVRFRDEEEVLRLANDTTYGLAAYFYTRDVGRVVRVMERLEYGIIGVNDPAPAVPQAPFGGFKESGIGREGGKYALEEFLEIKHVAMIV
ncbi:MAG: NAD-dependent succinate-semialdehyde dehydrogenase [Planctomycetes bacterium]|nr:NAD-dependent succinate-semialdehyde dehydrogenase [Planctomycetota bacterium]